MKVVYTHAEFTTAIKMNISMIRALGLTDKIGKAALAELNEFTIADKLKELSTKNPMFVVDDEYVTIEIPEKISLKVMEIMDRYTWKFAPIINAIISMLKVCGNIGKEMMAEFKSVENTMAGKE